MPLIEALKQPIEQSSQQTMDQQPCEETYGKEANNSTESLSTVLLNETPKQPIEQSSQQAMDQQPREETYGKEANNSTDEHFLILPKKPLETASEECDEEEL